MPLTSEVEASESEIFGGARPKTKSRASVKSAIPSTLTQETVAKTYDSHYRARQEQQLEDHAALLRDEVFNVVPGTVNMQCGTASKKRKIRSVITVMMRYSNCLRCQTCPLQEVAMGRKLLSGVWL